MYILYVKDYKKKLFFKIKLHKNKKISFGLRIKWTLNLFFYHQKSFKFIEIKILVYYF